MRQSLIKTAVTAFVFIGMTSFVQTSFAADDFILPEETTVVEAMDVPEQEALPQQTAMPQQLVAPQQTAAPQQAVAPQQTAAPQQAVAPRQVAAPQRAAAPQQKATPKQKKAAQRPAANYQYYPGYAAPAHPHHYTPTQKRTGYTREEIRAMPLLSRPNRPGHFIGNSIRRRAGVAY